MRISGLHEQEEAVGGDTEKGCTELQHLRVLHVDTCLSCMWVSLSPSASNSRVVFFRDVPLVSSYGPVRIINNITLHPSPHPTSTKW